MFEFTSDEIKKQFTSGSELNLDALFKLPTLFMPETGVDDELTHVGRITKIRENGKFFELSYEWDSAIPPVSNASFEALVNILDIDKWEFSRTHWAIKDADLYYALLLRGSEQRILPRVFTLPSSPINERLVSVMMPFSSDFDEVYSSITSAVRAAGKQCQRADDIWQHDAIIQDVVTLIATSSVVICDVSRKNANVYYEAGIAHTIGKDVILLAQSEEDIPFDLRHLRHIRYLNNGEGRQALAKKVQSRIEKLAAK
ncbi:MAG: hypothetical protein ACYDA1_10510 [Vulcanimicrobiaceae bacterium]